jgi:hypothetical protein
VLFRSVLIRDLTFGPADAPDLGTPQPVTSSTVPMPPEQAQKQHPAVEERAAHETIIEELVGEGPAARDATLLAPESAPATQPDSPAPGKPIL